MLSVCISQGYLGQISKDMYEIYNKEMTHFGGGAGGCYSSLTLKA